MIKKLSLASLLAVAVTNAGAIESESGNRFTYLSLGGAVEGANSLTTNLNKDDFSTPSSIKSTKSVMAQFKERPLGGYITGSYGFDNGLFLQGRVNYLAERCLGFFAGVGFSYPIHSEIDLYMMAGISQPNFISSINLSKDFIEEKIGEHSKSLQGDEKAGFDKLERAAQERQLFGGDLCNAMGTSFKKKGDVTKFDSSKAVLKFATDISPGGEIGVKAQVNEQIRLQAAYHLTWARNKLTSPLLEAVGLEMKDLGLDDGKKAIGAGNVFTHAVSVQGQYYVTPEWSVDLGYTYQFGPLLNIEKEMKDKLFMPKETALKFNSHRANIGVSFSF